LLLGCVRCECLQEKQKTWGEDEIVAGRRCETNGASMQ